MKLISNWLSDFLNLMLRILYVYINIYLSLKILKGKNKLKNFFGRKNWHVEDIEKSTQLRKKKLFCSDV